MTERRRVSFVAPCPCCGRVVRWVQSTEDTARVRPRDFTIDCAA